MVWLVAAVFVLQLLSSAAAIYFLRGQMLEVVRADRMRQVLDVRDDLLAAYIQGGRPALARMIVHQEGAAADPVVFIALTGSGAPLLSNLARAPGSRYRPARDRSWSISAPTSRTSRAWRSRAIVRRRTPDRGGHGGDRAAVQSGVCGGGGPDHPGGGGARLGQRAPARVGNQPSDSCDRRNRDGAGFG
jgi:hypothetical protein